MFNIDIHALSVAACARKAILAPTDMSKEKQIKKPSQAIEDKVHQARAYLGKLSKAKELSYAEMAEMVEHVEGLESPRRSAICHWVDADYPVSKMTPQVKGKIIKTAEVIETTLSSPQKITVGVVANSTEAILLHLLGAPLSIRPKNKDDKSDPFYKLPKALRSELERIPRKVATLHIVTKSNIPDLVKALQKGEDSLDFIVAPRHHGVDDAPDVNRLFRFMQCATYGFFPPLPKREGESKTERQSASGDFSDVLKYMVQNNYRIGVLQNGGFEHILHEFEPKQDKPSITYVTSSYDAFKKFRAGEIRAILGHRAFCANAMLLVSQDVNKGGATPGHLRDLEPLPAKTLDPVKLDIWCNIAKIKTKPRLAAKLFQLMTLGLKYIDAEKGSAGFNALVNHLLNLDELFLNVKKEDAVKNKQGGTSKFAESIQDAARIFDERTYYSTTQEEPKQYLFHIKTFETKTMELLWL